MCNAIRKAKNTIAKARYGTLQSSSKSITKCCKYIDHFGVGPPENTFVSICDWLDCIDNIYKLLREIKAKGLSSLTLNKDIQFK